MAFCKYCGSQIYDDSVFCSHCGKRLSGAPQSEQYPPPPEPERRNAVTERSPEIETAAQRAQRYQNRLYRNEDSAGNAGTVPGGTGGGPARQSPPMKFVIPAALMSFIVVMLIVNSISNHSSGGKKQYVPPTPPAVSISIPPELFNIKPTAAPSKNTPEPTQSVPESTDGPVNDEAELYENIADNVVAVLSAITERSDYIYGDFEPLIGVTDVNENGCAEILAVYEAEDDGTYVVRYDVWRASSRTASRIDSDVLFYEVGGESGKLHLLTDSNGAPYVMIEGDWVGGESFDMYYFFYGYTDDETELEFYNVLRTDGRYDTERGGIAEANYYTYNSDWIDISADEYQQYFDSFTTVYTLDILSGEYDWDNTLSFDWAWKAFGQER